MRKTILSTLLSLAMLATLSLPTANAQDKQVFNHLSIGVTAGLDGLGLELAASALYEVKDLMARAIIILDTRMYRSADSLELPEEDMACCRKNDALAFCHIKYVHELQNALSLSGIEKEITI